MGKAFFTELKALIAKYDPTTGVAEQPVQEQKNLFPEPGIWVFESKISGRKWMMDLKDITNDTINNNWAFVLDTREFHKHPSCWGVLSNVVPSTVRRPRIQELLELPDECPGKLRLENDKVYYIKSDQSNEWIFKFDSLIGDLGKTKKYCFFEPNSLVSDGHGFLFETNHSVQAIRIATPEDLERLPVEHELRGKKLATTYKEVVEAVKPTWVCDVNGGIEEISAAPYQLPTEQAAKQELAFIQIKNLEAYCADRFEGEREFVIDAYREGNLRYYTYTYGIIKVTKEAAEWLIANHPYPFLVFFGVN
ncbi:MAG: hypothetical protein RLY43_1238 [Bacteroidota bacterium]